MNSMSIEHANKKKVIYLTFTILLTMLGGCKKEAEHLALPPSTLKNRWKVELFFKWLKQHLRIKEFYGTSENAVKIQISAPSSRTV